MNQEKIKNISTITITICNCKNYIATNICDNFIFFISTNAHFLTVTQIKLLKLIKTLILVSAHENDNNKLPPIINDNTKEPYVLSFSLLSHF